MLLLRRSDADAPEMDNFISRQPGLVRGPIQAPYRKRAPRSDRNSEEFRKLERHRGCVNSDMTPLSYPPNRRPIAAPQHDRASNSSISNSEAKEIATPRSSPAPP